MDNFATVDFAEQITGLGEALKQAQTDLLSKVPAEQRDRIQSIFAKGDKAIENFQSTNPQKLMQDLMKEAMKIADEH